MNDLCPTSGKIRYQSASHARATMHQAQGRIPRRLRRHSRLVAFDVYRCPDCGAWHVSSRPRRTNPARKNAA